LALARAHDAFTPDGQLADGGQLSRLDRVVGSLHSVLTRLHT